jgi:hypothetical protein
MRRLHRDSDAQSGVAAESVRSPEHHKGVGGRSPPYELAPPDVLRLQAAVGNQAVQRAIRHRAPPRRIQRFDFSERPPTAMEASRAAMGHQDAMGEFLAASSWRLLDAREAVTEGEDGDDRRSQIERLISLNGLGTMASHRVTVRARRADMYEGGRAGNSMQPLRDAAFNLTRLEEIKDRVDGYRSRLERVETRALMRRGDLGENLDELALASRNLVEAEERDGLIERYEDVAASRSAEEMWWFLYGSANYMSRLRRQQIDAVDASMLIIHEGFPALSQLDPGDVEGFETDAALGAAAEEALTDVLLAIDDTIRDIHSGDIGPFDMPAVVESTRAELPAPQQSLLDEMRRETRAREFWRDAALTTAQVVMAFFPILGPVVLALGVASVAIQGEALLDRLQMADAGGGGENPLGVAEPTAFEQAMLGVAAVLTVAGVGPAVRSLRGGGRAASTLDDLAESVTDDLGGYADDVVDDAAREAVDTVPGGTAATAGTSEITTLTNVNAEILAPAVLERYVPGSGFSGAYNLDTGEWIALASGPETRLRSGDPIHTVSIAGGHADAEAALRARSAGIDPRRNVGFVLLWRDHGTLEIRWNSRTINARNFGGSRTAPIEFQDEIRQVIGRDTGCILLDE